MKLQDYLDEARLTYADFAAMIDATEGAVRRYAKGRRIPDRERMTRIALATSCKVTANDFFGISGQVFPSSLSDREGACVVPAPSRVFSSEGS